MKREQNTNRKRRYRKKMTDTKLADVNGKQRKARWKREEKIKKRNLSFASKGLNCAGEDNVSAHNHQ